MPDKNRKEFSDRKFKMEHQMEMDMEIAPDISSDIGDTQAKQKKNIGHNSKKTGLGPNTNR